MQRLLRLARWIDAVNTRIGRITYWLVLLMVGVGAWNVLGRYLGYFVGRNLSSNALIEVQWYLFDLVFLLGAAYTLRHNDHVRVDVLQARWSTRRKVIADLVGTLLFLLPFCVMVIWVSWDAIATSWAIRETSPDPGGLPRYPIKAMILVSFGLLILQGLSEAIKQVAFLRGQHSPEGEP
ncbi:Tripartite ATP-independent Periplasmic Transporter [Halomicronema hongdechloris C2206]|uniref:Tripartite ATP-independent Periplasmic Transporter n=1 Tax=Halomicronema hongdechloris C2206 TaxID=1641165 RepID=A0A1Z3HSP6_9CYAN|nr:TRAP transporter small permease subunit [Halomicronema hongdechloris]ASC73334.1 Tripartite ATP-independent Periplasmic Transporter [Halomicronema hongdechloris C2206]